MKLSFFKNHSLLLIILLGLVIRLFFFFLLFDLPLFDDANAYTDLALNISNHLKYENFEGLAYRPPIYPLFLSLFFFLSSNLTFIKLAQITLSLFSILLTYFLAQNISKSKKTALMAAFLVTLSPNLSFYPSLLLSETLFVFLLLFSLLLLQTNLNLLASFFWTLTILTRPSTFFFYPLWLLFKRSPSKNTLLALFFFFSCLSVWTLRNYSVFKKFVPFTTNSGLNFLIGNQPEATGAYVYPSQYSQLANLSEIEKNKLAIQLSLNHIKKHPFKTFFIALKKPFYLLSPFTDISTGLFAKKVNLPSRFPIFLIKPIVYCQLAHWGLLLLLSLPSFLPSQIKKFNLLPIFILVYTLSLLPFFAFSRFQIPLIPLFSVLAAQNIFRYLFRSKQT
jgi:hypothetical protein